MKTYRKAEAIVTQYNQDLAEWEQAVKNGQKPAEKGKSSLCYFINVI